MAEPLEFTVVWEAWYAEAMHRARPRTQDHVDPTRQVDLQCLRADGVSSYATFEEVPLGSRVEVRMLMWADGWAILTDHPSLWSRLAGRLHSGCSLEDVVALLTEYGATDVTPRRNGGLPLPTTTKD